MEEKEIGQRLAARRKGEDSSLAIVEKKRRLARGQQVGEKE